MKRTVALGGYAVIYRQRVANHRWPILLFVALTPWLNAVGEDPPALSETTQEVPTLLSGYRARPVAPNSSAVITLSPRPLLTFGDAARNNEAGTLWAWTVAGRPVAFIENYRPGGNDPNWIHALTLSSPALIELDITTNQQWKPSQSHFALQRCPDDVAAVAETAPQRLRQMKAISRRFQAHEFWDPNNSRFELRLLVQPVLHYSDEAENIVDGAVFVLAHGTNPEVLVQIEARREKEATAWNYGFVRLGSAEMHVAWDEKEVWTVPRTPGVVGQPSDPYWLCVRQNPLRVQNLDQIPLAR